MTTRRNQAKAIALSSDWGWTAARRVYCAFSVAMTGYFAFIVAWVTMNPVS